MSAAPVAPFRSTLQNEAPADTLTYVASGDLGSGLQRWLLLAAPGAGSPDAAAAARLQALGRLGRETATLVAPGDQGPAVTLISHVRRPAAVRAAMSALEPALATLIGASSGVAWNDSGRGAARTRTLGDPATAPLAWALDGTTLIRPRPVGSPPCAAVARGSPGRPRFRR